MKRFISILSVAALTFAVGLLFTVPSDVYAQQDNKGKPADKGFVDADNDGINDNARDDDGDGIPNGQDPDFVKPETSQGRGHGFVDADGDGVNDFAQDHDGDGIPNGQDSDWVPPQDGTGQKNANGNKGGAKGPNGNVSKEMNKQSMGKGKPKDKGFVDADGDGVNDNARDADGDGIPNGQDPDYERLNPDKGKGRMGFIDEDGDGINDLARDDDGDGIPNGRDVDYVRPQDGSGRQAGNGKAMGRSGGNQGTGSGSGDCDGTGPKGNRKGGGR